MQKSLSLIKPAGLKLEDFKEVMIHNIEKYIHYTENEYDMEWCMMEILIEIKPIGESSYDKAKRIVTDSDFKGGR